MTERLPFFHSSMYVRAQGESKTEESYQKLVRFFEGNLNGQHNYTGDMDEAKDEWSQDLEYLKETYEKEYT